MAIQGGTVQTMGPYNERLASLPDIPRRVTTGDGTEPRDPKAAQPQDDRALADGILAPSTANLQTAEPAIKFQTVEQLVRSQDRLARNRWNIDRFFRGIRSGIPYGRLEKIPNQSIWVCKYPNGMKESSAAVPNKADDLCNKVEDTLMADPVKLRPTGSRLNDETVKEAAKLAQEFLTLDAGEAGTNDVKTHRWSLNNAFTAATSVLHYVVDPTGGGYQPLQKLAHPKATDPQNPLMALVEIASTVPGMPPEQIEERATDPILRYVSAPTPEAPAGQFVESAEQADRVWLPKIRIERFRRESVRCFPANARVEDADAVVFIRYYTLAEARALWPKTVGQMTFEQLSGLASWRPAMWDLCVTYAFKGSLADGMSGPSMDDVGTLSPLLQRRMFAYRIYVKACPEYPEGYWLDVSGANGGMALDEGTLEYTVELPVHGKVKRCREIPGVQVTPMQDVDGGDPMGWPFISRFAGASEAEATLYAAFMDLCDNMLHPHVFLPSATEVDEDDWFDRTRPIVLSPDSKGPFYEQFPQLPPILPLTQDLDKKQDTISGLTATAQGLDSSNATSGVAKNLTIRQALVSLSGFQQEYHNAATRGGRIKCQLVQATFTTPMLIQYSGEEGSDQPQWWTGEDFAGVDRIGIQPGTGTMMTPEGKAQYVAFLQGQTWMSPDEAKEVALPGIRMDLGIPENVFEMAAERSCAAFLRGPTEQWLAAKKAQDEEVAGLRRAFDQERAQIGPQIAAQGVPVPEFQMPQMPPLPTPFPPRPNDVEPQVASAFAKRLSRLFMDPQFSKQPFEWQQTAVEAYTRYMQALMPPPAPVETQPGAPKTGPQGQPLQPKAPKVQTMGTSPTAPAPL